MRVGHVRQNLRNPHPAPIDKGKNPSVASIYRALAEHAKAEAYPEAVEPTPTTPPCATATFTRPASSSGPATIYAPDCSPNNAPDHSQSPIKIILLPLLVIPWLHPKGAEPQ